MAAAFLPRLFMFHFARHLLILLGALLCHSTFSLVAACTPDLTVPIPMRDGVALSADLYFPPNASPEERHPCILIRVPAGRKAVPWSHLADMAKHGYVVAIQDTRSAVDAEGKTLPYLSDGWGKLQDGYDTVEWLAKSPFTNGKIGTMGFSAAGITQLMLAPAAPPSLACQYVGQAAGSLYHHAVFPGGQLLKNQMEAWLGYYAPDTGVHAYVIGAPFYNDLWAGLNAISVANRIKVPVLHYGGWYDTFLKGTIDSFCACQHNGAAGAKGRQKLIIGPWNHYWPHDFTLGDFEVPENGRHPPVDISAKRWFDHHLKGQDCDLDSLPPVTYYVMGPFDGSSSAGNVWKQADTWPVPAQEKRWFLTGERTLSETATHATSLSYASDPNNPVPTIGGCNLFLPSGPRDQRPIEKRDDVVVFTSPPMRQDIEITGNLKAKLYFSADVADTDVVVRLCDVYPDGKSILIADGIYRTAVLNKKNAAATPSGDIQEIDIDLWCTSILLAQGHALRISVCGSNYPRYEKNLHVGVVGSNAAKGKIATHTIHVGAHTPSCIILPVVSP